MMSLPPNMDVYHLNHLISSQDSIQQQPTCVAPTQCQHFMKVKQFKQLLCTDQEASMH